VVVVVLVVVVLVVVLVVELLVVVAVFAISNSFSGGMGVVEDVGQPVNSVVALQQVPMVPCRTAVDERSKYQHFFFLPNIPQHDYIKLQVFYSFTYFNVWLLSGKGKHTR
jgi:hypothetical protein